VNMYCSPMANLPSWKNYEPCLRVTERNYQVSGGQPERQTGPAG
jgi:hypothetical protein